MYVQDCVNTIIFGKNATEQNVCSFFWNKTIVSIKFIFILLGFFFNIIYVCIYFSGFVDSDKVENYSVNRSKFLAKGRGALFTIAVEKMDEYVSDQKVINNRITTHKKKELNKIIISDSFILNHSRNINRTLLSTQITLLLKLSIK